MVQEGPKQLEAAKADLATAQEALAVAEAAVKAISLELSEKGSAGGSALPVLPENVAGMTVAELQEELRKYSLDTDWDPAKGKAVLVDRLTVCPHCMCLYSSMFLCFYGHGCGV